MTISARFEGDGKIILHADIAHGWHPFPNGGHGLSQYVKLDLQGDWTVRIQLKLGAVNLAQQEPGRTYRALREQYIQRAHLQGQALADARLEADNLMANHLDPNVAGYPQQETLPESLAGETSGRGYRLKLCHATATVDVDLAESFDGIVGPCGKRGVYGPHTQMALGAGFAYYF